jgi:hypothetical protein
MPWPWAARTKPELALTVTTCNTGSCHEHVPKTFESKSGQKIRIKKYWLLRKSANYRRKVVKIVKKWFQ